MAKQIQNKDLIQGQIWEPTIKETEALIKVLNDLEAQFKDVSKASAKAAQGADVGTAQGIKTVNQELEKQKQASNELNKINKQKQALDERLRQAESARGKVIERTNQRLLRQRQANRTLAKETDNLNSAYGRASARLTRLTKEYKDLEFQNKGNTREAKRLLRQITFLDARIKATDKSVGQSQRNVGNYSSAFKGLGGALGSSLPIFAGVAGAVAGLTAGLTAAAGLFREFGLVSAKVQAVSGATAEEFAALQTQAKALGETTPFTAANVAELQLELSKLGFTANQIQDSTDAILNFAIATDSELGRSAEVVASTLNAFQLEASEAGRVADVAAKAFSSSALDIEKFATAISNVGPAANAVDVSLERTTAILGKIVDSGVDASTAGTQLRNVFIELEARGLTWGEALEQINGSQNRLSAANDLFGKRGAVVATVIANNAEEIDKLDETLQGAAGSAQAAADIIGDTLDGDIKRFQSAVQGAVLDNEGFNDVLRKIVQTLTKFVGPAFDFLARTVNNIVDLFRPFGVIIEAVGDLFFEISKAFGLSSEQAGKLGDAISFILSPFELAAFFARTLADILKQLIEVIKVAASAISDFGSAIKKDFNDSIATVKNLAGSFGNLIGITNDLDGSISKQRIEQGKLKNAFDDTKGAADELIDKFKETTVFSELLAKSTGAIAKVFLDGFGFRKLGNDFLKFLDEINDKLSLKEIEKQIEQRNLSVRELNELIKEQRDLLLDTNTRTDAKKIQDIIDLLDKQKEAILGVSGARKKDTSLADAEAEQQKNLEERKLNIIIDANEEANRIKADLTLDANERAERLARAQAEKDEQLRQADIANLRNLIEVRGDILEADDEQQLKLKQQLNDALLNETEELINAEADLENEASQASIQNKKDEAKAIASLQKEIQEGTVAAIDVVDQAFAKASENRINEIDRQIDALKDREQEIRNAAQNGTQLQKDSLAENQRLQADQERAREEQVKKAQRREIVLAGLKAFAENAGQPGAVQKTLTDITTLSAALLNLLPGFYEGTEDTGTVGRPLDSNGGRLAVLHDNERVMTKEHNKLLGGLSNDEVAHIVHDHISPTHFDHAPIVQMQRFESNEAILQKFDTLVDKVEQLPHKMPQLISENFDEKSKVYTTVIKTGNKVEKNHKRVGGIWG